MIQPIIFAPAAARTVSGNGAAFDLARFARLITGAPPSLIIQSDVTAVSGTTPSITYVVEDSVDGATWNTIGTFAAQTGVNRAVILVGPSGVAQAAGFRWPFCPSWVRVRWTVSGTTPSLTGSVKGQVV